MTIPVKADFHVTGQAGGRVPSPRIFLAGWASESCSALFLLRPLAGFWAGSLVGTACSTIAVLGTGSGTGTAAGVRGITASKHWHTACSSERRSYPKWSQESVQVRPSKKDFNRSWISDNIKGLSSCFLLCRQHVQGTLTCFSVGWPQIQSCLWVDPSLRGLQRKSTGPRGWMGYWSALYRTTLPCLRPDRHCTAAKVGPTDTHKLRNKSSKQFQRKPMKVRRN